MLAGYGDTHCPYTHTRHMQLKITGDTSKTISVLVSSTSATRIHSLFISYIAYDPSIQNMVAGSYLYDSGQERFDYPELVVLLQAGIGYCMASGMYKVLKQEQTISEKKVVPSGKVSSSTQPAHSYGKLKALHSFAYIVAMFSTNWSLMYVSYPVQALAKSCKIVPAMIGGIFGRGKNYSCYQYLSAVLVVTGTIIFNFMKSKGSSATSLFGLFLLLLALTVKRRPLACWPGYWNTRD